MTARITIQTGGQVGFALRRLVKTHPLHAALIDRWRVRADAATPTMAIRLLNDLSYELTFSGAFVSATTADELQNVLLHEVFHVLLGHLTLSSDDFPNVKALTIAKEVTVNEFVPPPLPGEPLRLSMFPNLPPMESTARRYSRLDQEMRERGGLSLAALSDRDHVCADDHAMAISSAMAANAAAADLRAAMDSLPPDVRASAGAELRDVMRPHVGLVSADAVMSIIGGAPSQLSWTAILRSIAWRVLEPEPDRRRPSRRAPRLIGVVPGRRRAQRRPRVMVVLDTSASMAHDSIWCVIRGEVEKLRSVADVLVVECDARVGREYWLDTDLDNVRGGGGTSFLEPLSPAFLSRRTVDLVAYFTDGHGEAPARSPHIPVVWCLVGPRTRKPSPWGRVLRIPPIEDPASR